MKVRFVSVTLALLFSASLLHAQGGATGTILGTVTDNSGGVVPNASVDVTNIGTGVTSHAKTTAAGDYTVPYLNPGAYRISVEAPGFAKAVVNNVTLVVDQEVRVNAVLKPGRITESVEVRANAVALDTDNAAIAQLVDNKEVVDLPIKGRNWTELLFIGAGAVTLEGEGGSMRAGEGDAISINGARPESNNYTLDGLNITDNALSTPSVILSLDAIQEFKILSDTYSAEYGFSANQVNLVSKSGTNDLHGALFEFDRNNFFDARNPLQPKVPILRQNQFGFVVGGPVYLPHLYNGRNKTFFMVNYEGTRIRNSTSLFGEVPSPAELSGNFSASGLPEPGTAACAAALALNNPCMPENPATGAAFPNNTIPSTSFSRVAAVSLAANVFPAPNCLPSQCSGDNLRVVTSLPNTLNQQTYRLDQDLGRFGKIFGRGTYETNSSVTLPNAISIPDSEITFNEIERQWEVSHTITLHGTIVNNFRFGHLFEEAPQGAPAPTAAQVSALGLAGVFTKFGPNQLSYPQITLTGYSGFGGPSSAYTDSEQPEWDFADSLTWVRGKHTLSFGGDFRHWIINRNVSTDFLGDYVYWNNLLLTNGVGCATVVCGTGNAVSDFLLGYYQTASTYTPGPFAPTNQAGNPQLHVYNYFAPYVNDSWKVTNRLTLNLGLRWDFRSVPYEESNKFFWLDVNNPLGGLCFANKALLTDGVAPSGNGYLEYCGRRAPAMPGEYKPFAPRIGFAYRPFGGDKTVVRGGYGIYYDSVQDREIDDSGDLYPFTVRSGLTPATMPVTTAPKLTDQLFPSFSTLTEINPASLTFLAVIESERPLNPYVQQWTLSVERQLAKNTTLEVNYIGIEGTHLMNRHDIAQAYAPSNPAVCQANPANCPIAPRLPFPHFSGAYLDSDFMGSSNYNAGNIKLERRTGSGALTAIFTWAKSLDTKSSAANVGASIGGYQGFMNNHDPSLDYGPSDFYVAHRFVASYVYNLPFGRGKHFLSHMSKAADAALGGWEISGITTFQSGMPYNVSATDLDGILGIVGPFLQRADQVGNPNPPGFHRTTSQWINTAAFANPPVGVYGAISRNCYTQPGVNNWDIGLFKNIALTERMRLQLRLETFNAFNHPQYYVPYGGGWQNPDAAMIDASFGAITSAAPGRIVQLGGKIYF